MVVFPSGRAIAPRAGMEDWAPPSFEEIRMDAELTSYVAERDEPPVADEE
jgi:hypothetical protein